MIKETFAQSKRFLRFDSLKTQPSGSIEIKRTSFCLRSMPRYFFILFMGFFILLFSTPSHGSEENRPLLKHQVLYLIQSGEIEKGMRLYQAHVKKTGKHDFSTLEELGYLLLHLGAKSGDEESLILTMYALGIATSIESIDLYALGIKSAHPITQIATIQFLSRLQNDAVENLLFEAFSCPFLQVRMEAAHALALHRSEKLPGMLESLMQKLPPELHVYFPNLLAMVGTSDAIAVLKRLTGHPYLPVRLASIAAAAKYGRDDFLSEIRAGATHADPAEQEVCAAALGLLNDAHSMALLKQLATSKHLHVKLSACQALCQLGDHQFQKPILEQAVQKAPFTIGMLADIPNTEPLLISLLEDKHFSTQVNAALTLLKKRSPRCVPTLLEILVQDQKDLGFEPTYSIGHSLMAWKVIPSATHYAKKHQIDLPSLTLALREEILLQAIELPEESFLTIAREIFNRKQNALIPLTVRLLENLNTPEGIALLEEQAEQFGAPFVRTYCHLALYRLKNEPHHADFIYNWIKRQHHCELFQFRNLLSFSDKKNMEIEFFLTPKETSQLLIESYEALADHHASEGIDLLIEGIEKGHEKNRYVLAGLLLKAIQ